jgi:hypothetical protein
MTTPIPLKKVYAHMSNPRSFYHECFEIGVTLELLQEAVICVGMQATCRMFKGKSGRQNANSVSAGSVEQWIATLQYHIAHPEEIDQDVYQARQIEPYQSFYNYATLVKRRIEPDVVEMWQGTTLSNKSLGDYAVAYGITCGVRNSESIKTLRQRMLDMVERRRVKFWDASTELVSQRKVDYNLMNLESVRTIARNLEIKNVSTALKADVIKMILDKKEESNIVTNTLKRKLSN